MSRQITISVDEYERLYCCVRLLEVIAKDQSANPVKDAYDELYAHSAYLDGVNIEKTWRPA